ncbi:uncharacterized protein LOC122807980 [Protopterus annectens]|uniref:uncharacterized protein LOC122807980 n=1 Tax=Protopterus annectens TaxID=7888 RepID=UPI001CFB9FCB|nr:uncharacterized protein LOC122807980 [Protopterus annectens]
MMLFMLQTSISYQSVARSTFHDDSPTHIACAEVSNPLSAEKFELLSTTKPVPNLHEVKSGFLSIVVMSDCLLRVSDDPQGLGNFHVFPSGTYSIYSDSGWSSVLAYHCDCGKGGNQNPQNETAYQKFLRQHLDPSVRNGDDTYCNKEIAQRDIRNNKDGKLPCKEKNTFIHATEKEVKLVCEQKPFKDELRESHLKFHITVCERKTKSEKWPCKYLATDREAHIIIACNKKGEPIHFERYSPQNMLTVLWKA